jgi:hypothetical protein
MRCSWVQFTHCCIVVTWVDATAGLRRTTIMHAYMVLMKQTGSIALRVAWSWISWVCAHLAL